MSTGITIGRPLQSNSTILSLVFSPDGQRIVSGDRSGNLRIWDAKTGIPIGKTLARHQTGITSVSYSSDGQHIVSGSWDKTTIWAVSWKSLLPMACDRLRYHPSLNDPKTDVAREAKQTCEQYVWKK
jgi:WD40 repeat protein